MGKHEEARSQLDELYRLHPNDSAIQSAFDKCTFEIRRAQRPNYYELLGVPTVSSVLEIKTAYVALLRVFVFEAARSRACHLRRYVR